MGPISGARRGRPEVSLRIVAQSGPRCLGKAALCGGNAVLWRRLARKERGGRAMNGFVALPPWRQSRAARAPGEQSDDFSACPGHPKSCNAGTCARSDSHRCFREGKTAPGRAAKSRLFGFRPPDRDFVPYNAVRRPEQNDRSIYSHNNVVPRRWNGRHEDKEGYGLLKNQRVGWLVCCQTHLRSTAEPS